MGNPPPASCRPCSCERQGVTSGQCVLHKTLPRPLPGLSRAPHSCQGTLHPCNWLCARQPGQAPGNVGKWRLGEARVSEDSWAVGNPGAEPAQGLRSHLAASEGCGGPGALGPEDPLRRVALVPPSLPLLAHLALPQHRLLWAGRWGLSGEPSTSDSVFRAPSDTAVKTAPRPILKTASSHSREFTARPGLLAICRETLKPLISFPF